MRRFSLPTLAILVAACFAPPAAADDTPYPVAVRWWGQGMVSIENWYGFSVVIDPFALDIGYDDPGIEANTICITHEHADHNNPGIVLGEPDVYRGVENGKFGRIKQSFLIPPRSSDPNAEPNRQQPAFPQPGAIRITPVESLHDNTQGTQRGINAMFLLEADGVRILHCGDLGQHKFTDSQLAVIGELDVLCIPVGGVYTVDGKQAAKLVEQIKPRIVVPIHYKTDALKINLEPVDAFLDALPGKYEVVRANGNTLAASTAGGATRENPQVVVLDYSPWQMPADMAALIEAKEAASKKSQETFARLRVDQLNHKPSNGTHTPRWNVEHMLSAELFFFSNVYSQVDPSIQTIRLFPKQMPPQYEAANPHWNGSDEANQMQRVQDFTRRFAYLLDGMALDELPAGAPGFVGDLRGLFRQMENHYGEHTANVHKKFELEDWPE